MAKLGRIYDRILNALSVAAAVVCVYIIATVTYEIIMRYAFNRPTQWSLDFNEYALIYITFLAMAWVLSKDGHVKIDIVVNALPPRTQHLLNAITSVVGTIACALFFWYSFTMTWHAFATREIIWKSIIVPKGPIWIVIPFGSFFVTLQFLRRSFGFYLKWREAPLKPETTVTEVKVD